MIAYRITEAALRTQIETEKPDWISNAKKRTDIFRQAGKYDDDLLITNDNGRQVKASAIWSQIKVVYMRLQFDKCAYCERKLESEEFGKIECDVEHYRPKKKARPWRASSALQRDGVNLTPPVNGAHDPGYHQLAYHILNYCVSCKPCNSTLKGDYFPIEGPRNSGGESPGDLTAELPLLVYPVGDIDADPEDLIDFRGITPRARPGVTGVERRRALVTIVFFQLRNPQRKNLFRERADRIVSLYSFLQHRRRPGDVWDRLVSTFTSSQAPHASCARSFERLFETERTEADEFFSLAVEYLESMS